MSRATPYALAGIGLLGGLAFVSFEPLGTPRLNLYAGGALLAVAVGAITYMIAANSGPGERGPDF